MSDDLSPEEFPAFFEAVHTPKAEGGDPSKPVRPFPWQQRLAHAVFEQGWPEVLDVPTGAGKTAAIDIAVFHLALQAKPGLVRTAPVRILFVVDRRLIVDDAYERAMKIAKRLAEPGADILRRVAARLGRLAETGQRPLAVARLRGGVPKEPDWVRTPAQPVVIVSTIDQVGSRMFFRGYGVRDTMKSLHAGLLGADALLLLDEAHLSQPFVQTARDARMFQNKGTWSDDAAASPFRVVTLSATQTDEATLVRDKDGARGPLVREDDYLHPVLGPRLTVSKPAELIKSSAKADEAAFAQEFAAQAWRLSKVGGGAAIVVAVVVNRVQRARRVFEELERLGATALQRSAWEEDLATAAIGPAEIALLIGRTRELDRHDLLQSLLPRIKADRERMESDRPLFVVATQCVEAGADLDFHALVTEIAPLDSLRQRFGRLNRMGCSEVARAVILAASDQVSKSAKPDAIYGESSKTTWEWLESNATKQGKGSAARNIVDFGVRVMDARRPNGKDLEGYVAPRPDAPVLLPRDIAFWAATSPISAVDPEVSLYLHGSKRSPGDIAFVWRADIEPEFSEAEWADRVRVCPPSALEALSVPVGEAKRWLLGEAAGNIADVEGGDDDEVDLPQKSARRVLRWRGHDDDRTGLIRGNRVSPGDMIVVPSSWGGCDRWGWAPRSRVPVSDLGREANREHRNRDILRISRASPELGVFAQDWKNEIDRLREMDDRKIAAKFDLAAGDREGVPHRVGRVRVLRAADGRPLALEQRIDRTQQKKLELVGEAVTEDDDGMRVPAGAVLLLTHCKGVSARARDFAEKLGLGPGLVGDVAVAGLLHDAGKAHPAFKQLLYGASVLAAIGGPPLAKSSKLAGSRLSYTDACRRAGLKEGARHEVASLAFVEEYFKTAKANDAELVLWLVGTHHGHGRPFFPLVDWPGPDSGRMEADLGSGLMSTTCARSLAELTREWIELAARVQRRYGPWGLARLEAVLRLADHRQSEADAENADHLFSGHQTKDLQSMAESSS
jgi:CRISPR-associated endonuclease/helicase Cas3